MLAGVCLGTSARVKGCGPSVFALLKRINEGHSCHAFTCSRQTLAGWCLHVIISSTRLEMGNGILS